MKQAKLDSNKSRVLELIRQQVEQCSTMEQKIQYLNELRMDISSLSPFKDPVDCVIWVKGDTVQANEYNPNIVAPPEMELLHLSIKLDKFTQPIVAYPMTNGDKYEVVDGFHRNKVGKEYKDIRDEHFGYLPLVVVKKSLDERMASTIRHNRARGSHQIRGMSDLVTELVKQNWSDEDISKELGMELDEIIRLKQISGLKEAFANHKFSKSWEEFEHKHYDEPDND